MKVAKFIPVMMAAGVLLKFVLFLYIALKVPPPILCNDSYGYLNDARGWIGFLHRPDGWKNFFAYDPTGGTWHSFYRTPGYTFFLAFVYHICGMPLLGVIFLQLVLNILTAFIVYKTALRWGSWTASMAAAIFLLDLPTTIYSGMVLTESLHVLFIALFFFTFVRYLDSRSLGWVSGAAFSLMASVYVRPVGYYLGFAMVAFIAALGIGGGLRRAIYHALLFFFLMYGLLALWEYHCVKTMPYGNFAMSDIDHQTVMKNGLIGSYGREKNPKLKRLTPVFYYLNTIPRHFLNLMTTPGNLKYLGSRAWHIFGAVFGYLLVVFWWTGFLAWLVKDDKGLADVFLMLVLMYFIGVTIMAVGWGTTARFRVPMVPALAMFSSRGWFILIGRRGK